MYIRKTRNTEVIKRLDQKIFGEDYEEAAIASRSKTWWIAYVDGRIAGYAGLKIYKEGTRKVGYLCRAGVLKEFRGQGIQKALINVRDREARRQKVDICISYVANWNHASANNLIRNGYELYAPEYRYGLKDALYFWKWFKYRRTNV